MRHSMYFVGTHFPQIWSVFIPFCIRVVWYIYLHFIQTHSWQGKYAVRPMDGSWVYEGIDQKWVLWIDGNLQISVLFGG